jgi:hypothetical protein
MPAIKQRYGAPEPASKQEYAEQLQRQIEDKRKEKERERNYRSEPDKGFLANNAYGDTKINIRDNSPTKQPSHNQDHRNLNPNSKYHHARNDLHLEGRTENREQQVS